MTNTAKLRLISRMEILKTSGEVDAGGVDYAVDDNAPYPKIATDIDFDLLLVDDLSWNPEYAVSDTSATLLSTIGDGYDGLAIIAESGTVTGKFVMFIRILEALSTGTPDVFITWVGESANYKLSGVGDYILLKTHSRNMTTDGTKQFRLHTTSAGTSCNVEFFFGRVG